MRKIIVTLCSIALSFAASFGANELQPKDEAVINNNKEELVLEQETEEVEDTASLPKEDITTEETVVEDDIVSNIEEEAPKAEDTEEKSTSKKTKKDYKKSNKKSVTNTNKAAKEDNKNTNNNASNNVTKNTNNNTNNNTSINTNTNETKQDTNINVNSKKDNGNKYIYKNVDLSDCNSTQDVVNELQKKGYKKITMDNIQNVSSLEDILSFIGDKESQPRPKQSTPKQTAPTTTPTTTPTSAPSNPSNNSYADEVLRLVNIERNKAGLSNLTTNSSLTAAANKRAEETKISFSHTRPNGSKFSTALQEYGVSYRTAGENIAYGQRSPQEVVNGWMNSPGHRANILNASFNKIGIGVYQSGGVIYWTQLFTD